jgi:hypothetical protein
MTAEVIPFPRPVATLHPTKVKPVDPTPVTQTADELFETGVFPVKGDYVFTVRFPDDEEHGFIVSTPAHGRVRESTIDPTRRRITLTFDFGLAITVKGGIQIKWYADPHRKART